MRRKKDEFFLLIPRRSDDKRFLADDFVVQASKMINVEKNYSIETI